jgi:hypothetical protein
MNVVCPVIGLETIVNCPQHSMALKDVLKHPCIDEGWDITDGVTIDPCVFPKHAFNLLHTVIEVRRRGHASW